MFDHEALTAKTMLKESGLRRHNKTQLQCNRSVLRARSRLAIPELQPTRWNVPFGADAQRRVRVHL